MIKLWKKLLNLTAVHLNIDWIFQKDNAPKLCIRYKGWKDANGIDIASPRCQPDGKYLGSYETASFQLSRSIKKDMAPITYKLSVDIFTDVSTFLWGIFRLLKGDSNRVDICLEKFLIQNLIYHS